MTSPAIINFLEILKKDLASTMAARGQDRHGRIGKGLRVEETQFGGQLTGWKWIYTRIEFGRGKTVNGNDGGKTLREKLEGWVLENNIGDPAKYKSTAYLIARKIYHEGDQLHRGEHRLGRPTKTIFDVINDGRLDKLQNDLTIEFSAPIIEMIKNFNSNVGNN